MAKGYGLSGKIQGKLGSKVYRVEAGKQIISEYNPNKQDPKSDKQLRQRTKMAQATELSRRFPWECITALSVNRSEARRKLVGNIIEKTVVTKEGDEYIATVDLGQIQLSKGVPVKVDNFQVTKFGLEGEQKLQAVIQVTEASQIKRFLFITLYNANYLRQVDRALYALSAEVNNEGRCYASIVLDSSQTLQGGSCYSWAIPIYPNTLEKKVKYGAINSAPQSGLLTAQAIVELARADLFAASFYMGRTDFMPN